MGGWGLKTTEGLLLVTENLSETRVVGKETTKKKTKKWRSADQLSIKNRNKEGEIGSLMYSSVSYLSSNHRFVNIIKEKGKGEIPEEFRTPQPTKQARVRMRMVGSGGGWETAFLDRWGIGQQWLKICTWEMQIGNEKECCNGLMRLFRWEDLGVKSCFSAWKKGSKIPGRTVGRP